MLHMLKFNVFSLYNILWKPYAHRAYLSIFFSSEWRQTRNRKVCRLPASMGDTHSFSLFYLGVKERKREKEEKQMRFKMEEEKRFN